MAESIGFSPVKGFEMTVFGVGMTFFAFSISLCSILQFSNSRRYGVTQTQSGSSRCRAVGAFIAPSVHWGEPACFVRYGEMARGLKIDKCLLGMGIKNFIFWDFCFYPPAFFVSNGEMAKDLATN